MTNTVSEVIDDETLSCAIQIESAGKPNAKAPTSSATGLGQFINATWLGVIKQHRPDLAKRYPQAMLLTLRNNASLSIEMLARFWEDNAAIVGNASPGDMYLAHFLGAGTARKLYRAITTAPVEPIVGAAAVKANRSILEGKTCQQVRDWATRKMAKAGGHDWVAKWYDPNDPLVLHNALPPHGAEPEAEEIDDDAVAHKTEEPYDEPDNGVAPVDTTPHGEVNDKIANLQKALVDMGYVEVGLIDGAWGGATKGAIAAFLNDRGRDDLRANMSQPVLDEIAHAKLEGFKRTISQERAEVKPKDLAVNNPTMRSTLRTKALALWGGISGTVVGLFNGATSYFTGVWDYIAPLRKGLAEVPWFVWVALAVVACVLLYFNADTAEKDTTDAFKNRRLLR